MMQPDPYCYRPVACVARCPACPQTVPGTPSLKYDGLIRLDYHLHPVRHLGWCIGSGQYMAHNWGLSHNVPTRQQGRSS